MRHRGSVLIIAMWALSVLTIFALSLGADSRSKMTFIGKLGERNKLRLIAVSGVNKAVVSVAAKGNDPQYDVLPELGGAGVSSRFADGMMDGGKYSIGYQYYDPSLGETAWWQGVADSESRININKAEYKFISSVIRIAGGVGKKDADDIAAAIIDWRDTDEFPLMNGAESHYYLSLKEPYRSKNAEFEVLQELLLIRGISEEIYERIAPYVTIYGTGKVNMNTAGETVLGSLGMDKALVRKIIKYRAGEDRVMGTDDDNVFSSAGASAAELSQVVPLSPEEVAIISNLSSQDMISVVSSVFEIKSTARIGRRDQVMEIVCAYDRTKADSGENAVKYWHERYYVDPLPQEDDL
ncbi:MAG: hypothetical protein ABIG55_05685 [Candidatus Omnitrophota bacterium]|nr:general secretion pathway protein GspK [Candidatus Omnitrophota bacterium]